MLDRVLSLLAPPACAACGASPPRGDALCRRCRAALPWIDGRQCPRCALPAPCGSRCPAAGSAFSAAWAPLAYAGPARKLVLAFKERGAVALADLLGAQIAAQADAALVDGATLVPVPADPWRRELRGLDHAGLLTLALAPRLGLPARAVLARAHASRQRGVGAARRRAEGRLRVGVRGPVAGAWLLVDDVHTTGATLDACARALRAAGATDVRCVTYARTLP